MRNHKPIRTSNRRPFGKCRSFQRNIASHSKSERACNRLVECNKSIPFGRRADKPSAGSSWFDIGNS